MAGIAKQDQVFRRAPLVRSKALIEPGAARAFGLNMANISDKRSIRVDEHGRALWIGALIARQQVQTRSVFVEGARRLSVLFSPAIGSVLFAFTAAHFPARGQRSEHFDMQALESGKCVVLPAALPMVEHGTVPPILNDHHINGLTRPMSRSNGSWASVALL